MYLGYYLEQSKTDRWRVYEENFKDYELSSGCFSFCYHFIGLYKKTASGGNIVIWSFEEEDAWKPVIKNFQKNNKNYTVVYKKQKLDSDYENRVLNSIASGAEPDVWAMPNDWVFRHKEKLAPMPEGIAKSVNLDKQYVQSIKESVYINDKTYAPLAFGRTLDGLLQSKCVQCRLKGLQRSK